MRGLWSVCLVVACGAAQPAPPAPAVTASGAAAALPSPESAPVPEPASAPVLVTSGPGRYWQVGSPEAVAAQPDLRVDESAQLQAWDGFGGSFNEAGWEALSWLGDAERERALRLLFDPRDGARFRLARLPIGASDYALDRYTLAERPEDYTLESFSIQRDRLRLIPYVKAALAVQPQLQLWASPWTPPAWMKVNQSTDGGRIRDEPQVLRAYALYLARFVEEYAREGIRIGGIYPQNEPGYEQTYPTCLWSPELMQRFVRDHLGPTFAQRQVPAQLWLGTLSAPEDVKHAAVVLGDPAAAPFVKGIGVQWNTQNAVAGFATSYGLPIMQTEHRCGNYPWRKESFDVTRAPNDDAYAEETWGLIAGWVRAGVNSYLAWNMVLDTVGMNLDTGRPWPQNALLTVDRETRALRVTPAYYVFRHLSQLVEPGARRLATDGASDALAFRNPDGRIVTIVHNPGAEPASVTLGVRSAALRFDVPAHGWATVSAR